MCHVRRSKTSCSHQVCYPKVDKQCTLLIVIAFVEKERLVIECEHVWSSCELPCLKNLMISVLIMIKTEI